MKINFIDAKNFIEFYQGIADKEMSFQTSYKLNKLYTVVTEEFAFFSNHLTAIIEQYGQKDGEDFVKTEEGNIKIREDKIEECEKKLDELQHTIIQIPDIAFDIDEFSSITISPQYIEAIIKFIKNRDLI